MAIKNVTVIFIVSVVVAIAVYDVYAIVSGGVESSISHTMILWSYKYPAFTFMMGFTMGHLFWRMGDTKGTAKLKEGEK